MKFAAALAALQVVQANMTASIDDLKLLAMQQHAEEQESNTVESNQAFSPVTLNINGQNYSYFVAAPFSSYGDARYYAPYNGRGYITSQNYLNQSNPAYLKLNLLGGSIEWDVDLSNHGCSCVAAFYLVRMPGHYQNGTNWMNTDGWGYCDANKVNGNFCPEFDLMEANKFSWATTPHKCDSPTNYGFYNNCDAGGQCASNIVDKLAWNGYGPGGQYTIDTTRPFHAKVSFAKTNGQFSSYTTTLTQNGKTQSMTGNCSYLNALGWDMSGYMVPVVSNWSGGVDWLQKGRCQGGCNGPNLVISNIRIVTGR